jgi:hypothetical protein
MYRSKMIYSLAVASLLAFSSSSYASVTTLYNFGSLLATNCPTAPNSFASKPFAGLAATDTGGGIWDFKLTINNNLFTNFGNNSFIGSMSFDFNPDPNLNKITTKFVGSNGSAGVDGVAGFIATNTYGLTDIDFGTAFGKNAQDRLSQNDWVEWKVYGLGISSLRNMYLTVKDIGGNYCGSGKCSAEYTPLVASVPEPETYAMLLAGLGLVGFSARRRMNNA